jgi:hypothetical protein
MKEKRKNIRYPASAQIRMSEAQSIKLFLKDICINGCAITNSSGGPDPITIVPETAGAYPATNQEYSMLIFPETESGVAPFELTVELYWFHIQNGVYEAGGFISGCPEGKKFQLFADYLAWRVIHT